MTHIANPFVVVLDANVLYPFRVRDVLLRFAQRGLYRARLTDEIMIEWKSSLIKNRPDLAESVRSQDAAIRSAFRESFVTGHLALVAGLHLPDPNDRHVLAAAIKCSAQHIVTENIRDFPTNELVGFDIEAISADDFLAATFDLFQFDAMSALREQRLDYNKPSFSPSEFITDLTARGLPKLAAKAREHIEFL